MNIESAIIFGTQQLKALPNGKLEAEVLLSAVLKKDRIYLKTNTKKNLFFWQVNTFKKYLKKRSKHIPTAYILGHKDWYDLRIQVSRHTLIPRDETEILCDHILKSLGDIQETHIGGNNIKTLADLKISHHLKSILDVGTGSGCIAILMKKFFPMAKVQAVDISSKALKMAQKNAAEHNAAIDFSKSDLLENIKYGSIIDLIIANLPYIPENMVLAEEVNKEPRSALFSGKDGLDHIRKLANQLKEKNIMFGALWLEFLPQQKDEIQHIFLGHSIQFFPDAGGDIFFAQIKPF